MKLNKKDIIQLREKVEVSLEEVPDGKRIHIDKDILESLIFDTCTAKLNNEFGDNSGKNVKVKYVVWSGDFLSKIDLSEVSFDDVIWDIYFDESIYFQSEITSCYSVGIGICLKNTNARIDFSKSFQVKLEQFLCISNCDFTNVDLSNNEIDYDCNFTNTNLCNTGLKIIENNENSIDLDDSNMRGTDLSHLTVDENSFSKNGTIGIENCDLSYSGLNINTTPISNEIWFGYKTLINLYKKTYKGSIEPNSDCRTIMDGQLEIGRYIREGRLVGCYVNGKEILSDEEYSDIANSKKEEYKKMKLEIFNSIENSIKSQNE